MKKILSVLLIICVICLTGCAGSSGIQDTSVPVAEPVQTTVPVALSDEEIYFAFLSDLCEELRDIIVDDTHLDGFGDMEGMAGINEIAQRLERDMLDKIGYQITDLNGDGIQELLICAVDALDAESCTGTRILCAYTVSGNEKILLLDGYTRNSYCLLKDDTFYNEGSRGDVYVCRGIYRLEKESDKLSCVDFYFTDTDENGNKLFFHNQTGEWNMSSSESFDGDETAFWTMCDEMASRIQTIELMPLSAFEG